MKKFDPKHAAKHGYTEADWAAVDSPELTEADMATARPFSEAFPALADAARKSLGRPKSANPKVAVSLRLDPDVVAAFKASGQGWQSRMNEALRKAAHLS
ncbi:BrnA antitoxin family protein [Pseudogemmobacter faecipullorum]|uniref:BrnA antitoxin family protein n=1 Tax=Pseudogemmobacter faecipullorum TaxID=2755041 RepID=A0ABS8CSR7_9RHOB|nr:BrnA antitoxin family protein [Pseudogemmobacter faecipullorum]MCB5412451.1 BrnA antitoxin family protein [Pseudogemmobacter faecipullorum]